MVSLDTLALLAFSGLVTGCLYALVALTFGIVYRATKVFNFAQGEFLMVAGYLTWWLGASADLPFWISLVITLVVLVIASIITMRVVIQPLMGQHHLSFIMVTLGLSFVLRGTMGAIFGTAHTVLELPVTNSVTKVGPLRIMPADIVMLVLAVLLLGGLIFFFNRTSLGLGMRATASREDVAELMGVRIERIHGIAWALAGFVTVIAGIMIGSLQGVSPDMGALAFKAFPALIIGGFDNIAGAVVGGLVVGIIENLVGGAIDLSLRTGIKESIAYVLLIVLLVFRPYGFFGKKEILRV